MYTFFSKISDVMFTDGGSYILSILDNRGAFKFSNSCACKYTAYWYNSIPMQIRIFSYVNLACIFGLFSYTSHTMYNTYGNDIINGIYCRPLTHYSIKLKWSQIFIFAYVSTSTADGFVCFTQT